MEMHDSGRPAGSAYSHGDVADDVILGRNVRLGRYVNLYGCRIGDETRIGAFVEIQRNALVGARCKISSHTFICEGVIIEDECFVGHHVCFTNDLYPRAVTADGCIRDAGDWRVVPTLLKRRASIGSGAVILCGITIGANAIIGAGAVVTRDVENGEIVAGVPARHFGRARDADPPEGHSAKSADPYRE